MNHRFTNARNVLATLMLGGALIATPALAGKNDDRHAAKARSAMEDGKSHRAVEHAERAVMAMPGSAELRVLLGQAYLDAGRMASARDSLTAASALGDDSPRTALMLALAQIGAHNPVAAVATLDFHGPAIPDADRGLALALAGETARGINVIAAAVRNGDNSAKARQNLAYAYALDGRWREARMMAAQDLPANMIDERISTWAVTARPEMAAERVAALLGTTVVADSGQPTQLALTTTPVPEAPAMVAPVMAQAEPAPVPAPMAQPEPEVAAPPAKKDFAASFELPAVAESSPVETVAVAPSEAPESKVETAAVASSEARKPDTQPSFVRLSVVQKVPEAPAEPAAKKPVAKPTEKATVSVVKASPKKAEVTKVAKAAPKAAPLPTPGKSGSHVAQLGSFTSKADAARGWKVFQSRYANLSGQKPVVTQVSIDGTEYYRVSAGGFDLDGATAMCRAVKASGHGCLPISKPSASSASRLAKRD